MQREDARDPHVKGIGYNEEDQALEVEYHNGKIRRYRRVPPVIYRGFWRAPRKDLYIAKYVHGVYPWVYIDQDADIRDVCERLKRSLAQRDAAIDCLIDGITDAMKKAIGTDESRGIAVDLMGCVRDCRLVGKIDNQVRGWIEAMEEGE